MKRITSYMALAAAASAFALVGCDSDADKLYIDGLEASTLIGSQSELVLNNDDAAKTAIAFTWSNESKLILHGSSTVGVADKSMPAYTIEISLSESFDSTYSETVNSGIATFTVQALNTIVRNLGANYNERTAVYVRLKTALGTNDVDYEESNIITLYVTPYKVDYTIAKIYNKDKDAVTGRLYALDEDNDGNPDVQGIYYGFVGASAWENFWVCENDGTFWGNVGEDGNEFKASKDANSWNFWYPGKTGCFYTVLNVSDDTEVKQWSATWINTLNVTGDVEDEMTYIRSENRWMCTFTSTKANSKFKVAGTGKVYNVSTGTNDEAAIDTDITFGAEIGADGKNDGKLIFGDATEFNIDKAGTYTLSLYLSEYNNLRFEITDGAEDKPLAAPDYLYIRGLDNDWSNEFRVLNMVDADNIIYKGAYGSTTCPYGMYFVRNDNKDPYVYGGTDIDSNSGDIVDGFDSNIKNFDYYGVNIWTVNLSTRTYNIEKVNTVQYAGFNDNWDLVAMTQDASDPTKYYATITINAVSTYGGKFVLNGNWDNFVGGTDGKLEWGVSATDDKTLEAGTYILKLDFTNMAYSFTTKTDEASLPENLYAIGINGDWDTWVTLTKTATGVYSGSMSLTSSTEFEVYSSQDYSSTKYGPAIISGSVTSGSSVGKFSADGVGAYTFTIDLTTNSYNFEKTASLYPDNLYAIGMDDDWKTWVDFTTTADGIYSVTLTIEGSSTKEFEVYADKNWGTKYGPKDNDGNVTSGSDVWKFWVNEGGTYVLTIDLTTNTYTIVKQ